MDQNRDFYDWFHFSRFVGEFTVFWPPNRNINEIFLLGCWQCRIKDKSIYPQQLGLQSVK